MRAATSVTVRPHPVRAIRLELTSSDVLGTLRFMFSATDCYRIRSYEIDDRGQLKVLALCDYLQESAGSHARQLGVAVDQLLQEGMTWFLWRLHLRIGELPAWGELVEVETWPAALGKPYAIRDFRITSGGQEIGVATSAWLLMDVVKKRPIRRFPDHIRDLHPETPRRALPDSFHRLPACEEPGSVRDFVLRRSDLDLNGHLNHVASMTAMLEAVPASIFDPCRPESLEVEFRGEGRYGDDLEARCQILGGETRLQLVRKSDGKEIARGRSHWRASVMETS